MQIFLPRFDGRGRRVPRSVFETIARELTKEFGGVTAFLHSPALGLWRKKGTIHRDAVVVFEIMVPRVSRAYWHARRRRLEIQFRQREIVIRALSFDKL